MKAEPSSGPPAVLRAGAEDEGLAAASLDSGSRLTAVEGGLLVVIAPSKEEVAGWGFGWGLGLHSFTGPREERRGRAGIWEGEGGSSSPVMRRQRSRARVTCIGFTRKWF